MIIRFYAQLLRLYPREFYERFSTEMLDVFTQAWHDHPSGYMAVLAFSIHEFGGLLMSIVVEHGRAGNMGGLRMLLRRRFVPVWLFIFSLIMAAIFSMSYWGYLTRPLSTISALQSIDRIALVQFDANYIPKVIPLNDLPYLITPVFPPSQILSKLPTNLEMDQTLDLTLIGAISAALTRTGIELGALKTSYSQEPVMNPNGCGAACFTPGVQPQADGSLLISYPKITVEGQVIADEMIQRVTANDWGYYAFIAPAGYIVQGRDANGESLIFAAIASGAISNDHYRYHELTFMPETDGLSLRSQLSYNFDIAGLEEYNFAVVTMFLFVSLLCLWLALQIMVALVTFLGRRMTPPRSIA